MVSRPASTVAMMVHLPQGNLVDSVVAVEGVAGLLAGALGWSGGDLVRPGQAARAGGPHPAWNRLVH